MTRFISTRIAPVAALLTLLFTATTAQASIARQAVGDGYCARGETLMSAAEARRNVRQVCRSLDRWAIARLAGGGSMDGPGYGCKVRAFDRRDLGHSVCRPASRHAVRPVEYRPAPRPDVYRPKPRPDVYRPSPRPAVYRPAPPAPQSAGLLDGARIGLRTAHGGWLVAKRNGSLRADGRRMGKRATFSLVSDHRSVYNNSTVSLRAYDGDFVVAEPDGRANANRGRIGAWETWRMQSVAGHGRLQCGDRVNLLGAHGQYLVAEPDGRANANRRRAKRWETFTVVCLDR